MTSTNIIDLTGDGTGTADKKYFTIPLLLQRYLPAPTTLVLQLVAFHIPEVSDDIVSVKPLAWFRKDAPMTDPVCILSRLIPSQCIIQKLEDVIYEPSFRHSSLHSIADPRFNDGMDRLLLWIVTFWREMSKISLIRSRWVRSVEWLETQRKQSHDGKTVDLIRQGQ
ncbi:hypothetical protein BDQ17DRAFT_1441717 [Cyathus striatus]|nr:hypothetical protein BDQ17DRAFT_1441717 [Cyathus striatus]